MFEDRKQAGQRLAEALKDYKHCDGIIFAIPRGGAEVGYYVAEFLQLPLSIVVVRKLPFPENPESGFGAIAEDGSIFISERLRDLVSEQVRQRIIGEQKQELDRRIKVIRQGKPLPDIKGKTVILVDDGIAVGSTMHAAVMLCKNKKASRIAVAVPVAGPAVVDEFAEIVDEIVVLEKPAYFTAVAEVYRNWYDVSDNEVVGIIQKSSSFSTG